MKLTKRQLQSYLEKGMTSVEYNNEHHLFKPHEVEKVNEFIVSIAQEKDIRKNGIMRDIKIDDKPAYLVSTSQMFDFLDNSIDQLINKLIITLGINTKETRSDSFGYDSGLIPEIRENILMALENNLDIIIDTIYKNF